MARMARQYVGRGVAGEGEAQKVRMNGTRARGTSETAQTRVKVRIEMLLWRYNLMSGCKGGRRRKLTL